MDAPFIIAIIDHNFIDDDLRWLKLASSFLKAAQDYPWLKVQLRAKKPLAEDIIIELHDNFGHASNCHWNIAQPLPAPVAHRHLPENSLWPKNGTFSVSVHSLRMAIKAQHHGAQWVQLAPIFQPTHKPGRPIGVNTLQDISQNLTIPVVGAGGISLRNADSVIQAGAYGVASIGTLLCANNPINTAVKMFDSFT